VRATIQASFSITDTIRTPFTLTHRGIHTHILSSKRNDQAPIDKRRQHQDAYYPPYIKNPPIFFVYTSFFRIGRLSGGSLCRTPRFFKCSQVYICTHQKTRRIFRANRIAIRPILMLQKFQRATIADDPTNVADQIQTYISFDYAHYKT
jgi:hypothetical protein